MTTLLTARCQNFTAPCGFHAGAEAMGFMAPAYFGLKGAFGQTMLLTAGPDSLPNAPRQGLQSLRPSRQISKRFSLSDHPRAVKARQGIGDRAL